ncbi:hypothetical protein EDD86DRAFT_87774 [Gorgonomyces haynaldii]|nr:hypothetical protein EDD86DRAFT_87774 [Gorgonomyces haynaldii]
MSGMLSHPSIRALQSLLRIRMSHQNLRFLSDLEHLSHITHLYLGHNLLIKLPDMSSLVSLRFLILADNMLESIAGLEKSPVELLDLSGNKFSQLDCYPSKITYLMLRDNPMAFLPDYRLEMCRRFPDLEELDEREISSLEKRLARPNDPFEEEEESICTGEYDQVLQAILDRSKERQQQVYILILDHI